MHAANKKTIEYIPCRLKFSTPVRGRAEWTTVEYVGQATYKDGYLYLSLLDDSTSTRDYVQISIKTKSSINHFYAGMYSSVTAAQKRPYSSVVVLDSREHLMADEELLSPDTALDFMYENHARFQKEDDSHPISAIDDIPGQPSPDDKDYEKIKFVGLSDRQRETIKRLLAESPFSPNVRLRK